MKMIEKHSIDAPDEVRPFKDHGHLDVVTIGDFTLGRGTYEPGWRWSQDVKPIAGTDLCMARHSGVCLSGEMTVQAEDGTEVTFKAGDVVVIEPGHDAWVNGNTPCVLFDTTGVPGYAQPPH